MHATGVPRDLRCEYHSRAAPALAGSQHPAGRRACRAWKVRHRAFRLHCICPAPDCRYGEAATIDQNIGKYYRQWIHPYTGSYGAGSADGTNHFWPCIGNHDSGNVCGSSHSIAPYLAYLPALSNQRYYHVLLGERPSWCLDAWPASGTKQHATSRFC